MIKLLDRFKIRTRLILLVVFSAVPLIVLLGVSLVAFNQLRSNWNHFNEVIYQKQEYLTDIVGEIGYGGFIHLYKNYIITGDNDQFTLIEQKHHEISLLIKSYREIGELSEEEDAQLSEIKEMLDVYKNGLSDIKQMKEQGLTPAQIESGINVDYNRYKTTLENLQDTLSEHTDEDGRTLKSTINISLIIISILTLLIFLDVVTTGIFISHSITRRINRFIDKFKIGMEGDLTIRMDTDDSKNEMNTLATYFNDFMNLLSGLITGVKSSISKTKDISTNLSSSSEESTSALTQIRSNIEGMSDKTAILDKEINRSKNTAQDVNKFISEVVDMISNQASAMSESSASIEEMSASIQNIAKVSEDKLNTANELEEKANLGEKEMQKTMDIINRVADSANVIVEMMDVINNIAGQTDLLAMNASIEAAHAGESGRGFAVVADEIRNLAESTTENSKNISESLKKIIRDIKSSEESTNKTSSFFHSIVDGIKEVANGVSEMRNTNQELASGSNQVLKSLSSLVSVTDQVKTSSEEMSDKVKGIEASITNINSISTDVKNGMREVSSGVNELFIISKGVADEGTKNMESVSELEDQISKIITEEDKDKKPVKEHEQTTESQEQKSLPEAQI
jgi:methyl-accepting chemotaxis protein